MSDLNRGMARAFALNGEMADEMEEALNAQTQREAEHAKTCHICKGTYTDKCSAYRPPTDMELGA